MRTFMRTLDGRNLITLSTYPTSSESQQLGDARRCRISSIKP